MLTFKQMFPTWESFDDFIKDTNFYYDINYFTKDKVIIYYTLLYRNFANSHLAYDNEIFIEMLSLKLSENFKEFFLIRDLLEFSTSREVTELITGLDSITNVAENPNIGGTGIVNYIGAQTHTVTKENIIDRVYNLVQKIHIPEIQIEVAKYQDLFLKIIPRTCWLYEEEEDEN